MLTVRLPNDAETLLAQLAENTGKSKSHHVREAVLCYLANLKQYEHWQASGATTMQAVHDALNEEGEFMDDSFSLLDVADKTQSLQS